MQDLPFFALVSIFKATAVFSKFMSIDWNTSTDLGQSRNERLYEYPMFTEVAPAECDLTADFCDPNCCADPDCNAEQKGAFSCFYEGKSCSRPFARYDCNCAIDKPFWFPVLCYVFENPIYLGKFYKTPSKIEKVKDFVSKTNSKGTERDRNSKHYVFGSPVLAYVLQNGTFISYPHSVLHENLMVRGLSRDCQVPVRYLINSRDSCYVRLTKELCDNGVILSVRSYLLRNLNSTDSPDIPFIIKDMEEQKPADVDVILKYSPSKYIEKKFNRRLFKYFYLNGEKKDYGYNPDLFHTYWNGSACHNVIAEAKLNFTVDGSKIANLEVELTLTNVSLVESEFAYINKFHHITFSAISFNSEGDNYMFNRGYYIGENLNFGFKRENGSELQWEKGHLRIYLSGGECNRSRDVTFGYNTYSRCSYKSATSNCTALREEVEEKLDALINGSFLAPYGNYRDGGKPAIRVLRDYIEGNFTKCAIPTQQDITVQYVTITTEMNGPVHRAIGIMVSRNYDPPARELLLAFRVTYVQVPPAKERPLSRFWEKMLTPEQSENAWLYMFRVFDDPVEEEATFWAILFFVVVCATRAVLRDSR